MGAQVGRGAPEVVREVLGDLGVLISRLNVCLKEVPSELAHLQFSLLGGPPTLQHLVELPSLDIPLVVTIQFLVLEADLKEQVRQKREWATSSDECRVALKKRKRGSRGTVGGLCTRLRAPADEPVMQGDKS